MIMSHIIWQRILQIESMSQITVLIKGNHLVGLTYEQVLKQMTIP